MGTGNQLLVRIGLSFSERNSERKGPAWHFIMKNEIQIRKINMFYLPKCGLQSQAYANSKKQPRMNPA